MNHGDGKNVDITMVAIHLMQQEAVERESSLTVIKTLTNGLKLPPAGHISVIIQKEMASRFPLERGRCTSL